VAELYYIQLQMQLYPRHRWKSSRQSHKDPLAGFEIEGKWSEEAGAWKEFERKIERNGRGKEGKRIKGKGKRGARSIVREWTVRKELRKRWRPPLRHVDQPTCYDRVLISVKYLCRLNDRYPNCDIGNATNYEFGVKLNRRNT